MSMLCRVKGCAALTMRDNWLCEMHEAQRPKAFVPVEVPVVHYEGQRKRPPPEPVPEPRVSIANRECPPSLGVVDLRVLDTIIHNYHTFRPAPGKDEYNVPSWARALLFLIVYSGQISFDELCLRAALRRDTCVDLHVDRGKYEHLLTKKGQIVTRHGRGASIRYFMVIEADPSDHARTRVRSICFLRRDVALQLTFNQILFATHYVHMHPQCHVKIALKSFKRARAEEEEEKQAAAAAAAPKEEFALVTETRTGMTAEPMLDWDAGQTAIATHAAAAEYQAGTLSNEECEVLNKSPFLTHARLSSPDLVGLAALCTDDNCAVCYAPKTAEQKAAEAIQPPVELFEPLDFFLPSWRDLPDEYDAFNWWDQKGTHDPVLGENAVWM